MWQKLNLNLNTNFSVSYELSIVSIADNIFGVAVWFSS